MCRFSRRAAGCRCHLFQKTLWHVWSCRWMWLPLAALASGGLTLQWCEGRSLQDLQLFLSITITKRAKENLPTRVRQVSPLTVFFFLGFSLPWMHQFTYEGETWRNLSVCMGLALVCSQELLGNNQPISAFVASVSFDGNYVI